MHAKSLFEYAVIRVVPRVEREEFINVGVIVYCKEQQFLQMKYVLEAKKLSILCADLDLEVLDSNLKAMENICAGTKEGGAIATQDKASRFRWLTATRSTVIQHAKVHPGYTDDAEKTMEKLFVDLVS